MEPGMEGVPGSVLALWWGALAVTVIVVVPLAIYLLHRTWRAAREIQRYTREALEAGVGIADHVSHLDGLDRTVEIGSKVGRKGEAAKDATARVGRILAERSSA